MWLNSNNSKKNVNGYLICLDEKINIALVQLYIIQGILFTFVNIFWLVHRYSISEEKKHNSCSKQNCYVN